MQTSILPITLTAQVQAPVVSEQPKTNGTYSPVTTGIPLAHVSPVSTQPITLLTQPITAVANSINTLTSALAQPQYTQVLLPPQPRTIELRKHQVEHFTRMQNILLSFHGALDTSPLGAGKTFTSLALAAVWRMAIFVVCPASLISMWQKKAQEYGITLVAAISYETLRGTTSKGVSHPFLTRHQSAFVPTDYYRQWLNYGIILIFDEIDKIKNPETAQLQSAHTLVAELVRLNNKSRVLLLSNTPCDKEKFGQSMLRMLGIITEAKLYTYDRSSQVYNLLGMQELLNRCRQLDPLGYQRVMDGFPRLDQKTINKCAYRLYVDLLKNFVSSAMPEPERSANRTCLNVYYKMSDEDVALVAEAEGTIKSHVRYNEMTGALQLTKETYRFITLALTLFEKGLRNTLVRVARETLTADPNAKVIIYAWFRETIEWVASQLVEFNPGLLYGKISVKARDKIIGEFQQPNNYRRLIISHPLVGGVGVSLDDQHGGFKRTTYMVPNYHVTLMHQAGGRTFRTETKSDATIIYVWCDKHRGMKGIIEAISKKSTILREVNYLNQMEGLPSDFGNKEEISDGVFADQAISNAANMLNRMILTDQEMMMDGEIIDVDVDE